MAVFGLRGAAKLRAMALAVAAVASPAAATPVTVNQAFLQLRNIGINSLGFTSGPLINFGANSVSPNGGNGTTGLASTCNTALSPLNNCTNAANGLFTRSITFNPSPLNPNFFIRGTAFNSNLLGPWTLAFSNGVDTTTRVLSLPTGAVEPAFVNSITLSGTSTNPIFSWTPPPGTPVDGYRINIYDKSLVNQNAANGPLNTGQVTSRDVLPSQTSYTVTGSDFTIPGYGFTLGKNYSIEIVLLQTRDGTTNTANSNVYANSRVYADFTPVTGGGPVVNLPVVNIDGAYQFNITVVPNQTYYLDPLVAVGYVFETGVGDPNFQSVLLPADIGDGKYDIYGYDALGNPILLAHDWLGGVVFDFGLGGRNKFEVLGIETSAGLDPNSTTAFITGMTFTGAGQFTGTQTPVTEIVAPEPASLAVFLSGLGVLGVLRRRQGRVKYQGGAKYYARNSPLPVPR